MNRALACAACNLAKADKTMGIAILRPVLRRRFLIRADNIGRSTSAGPTTRGL